MGHVYGVNSIIWNQLQSPHIAWRNPRNLTCVTTVVVQQTITQTTLNNEVSARRASQLSAGARPPQWKARR